MGLFKYLKPMGSKTGIARWGNSKGGGEPDPIEPDPDPGEGGETEVFGIVVGASKVGEQLGYLESDKKALDYGEGNAIVAGQKLKQLALIEGKVVMVLAADAEDVLFVNLGGVTVQFTKLVTEGYYECADAEAAALFVEEAAFRVEDGNPGDMVTPEAPGTDVDTLTPEVDPVDPTPEPELHHIICGVSEAGDAFGYHKADTDSYGYANTVTIDGVLVKQVRALGSNIRIHLVGDEASKANLHVNIGGIGIKFKRDDNQPRYSVDSAEIAALFVIDAELLVEDGADTIEPETKPVKATKNVKKKK